MGFAFIFFGGGGVRGGRARMFQIITTGPDGFGEGMEDLHIPLVPDEYSALPHLPAVS